MNTKPAKPTATCGHCGAPLAGGLAGNCPACLTMLVLAAGADTEPGLPPCVGDYEPLGEIARGGFGVVYRARQRGLNRLVALKVLLGGEFASAAARRRFHTEAEAVAQLQHPHIVTIFEVGEHDGLPFYAMELVEGRSLAEVVGRQPLAPRVAAELLRLVAEAIHYAHSRGVLHRDLKPSNILLDELGRPRVTDFGLARRLESEAQLTRPDETLGSPSYLPPERLRRQGKGAPAADPVRIGKDSNRAGSATGAPTKADEGIRAAASDIYSLGATLYHLLAGRPPFVGDSVHAVLAQVEHDEPVSPRRLNPAVSRDLETICLKCLEKDPARRYASAADLAADLGRFHRQEPIGARPVGFLGHTWRWCRRQPAVASLIGLLTLALVSGALGVTAQWRRAEHARERSDLEAYAADLRLASQAINEGDLGHARRLLAAHRNPAPDFAWRLLWQQCRGDHSAVVGTHSWIVAGVAWSPDGRRLLSGGLGSGTVAGETKLWDLSANPPTGLRLTNAARQVVWPRGGGRFFTANQDQTVRVWDVATRAVVKQFVAHAVAVSADGERVLLGAGSPFWWEPDGTLPTRLWLPAMDEVRELPPGNIMTVSPDGQWAAIADQPGRIRLCSLPDGKVRHELPTAGKLWALVFSADNRWLVGTGVIPEVRVWGLQSPKEPPRRLEGHSLPTWTAAFSPDGQQLVTTSSDRSLRFWRVGSWEEIGRLRGHGDEAWCAEFRPDGTQLASGGKDHQVLLWQPPAATAGPAFPVGAQERPLFSADGRQVASGPAGRSVVTELKTGTTREIPYGTLVSFSGDGRGYWTWRGGFQFDRMPLAGAAAEAAVTLAHEAGEALPMAVVMGAGESRVAGRQPGGVFSVWSMPDGRRICRVQVPGFEAWQLNLSQDGRRLLAVGGESGGLLVMPADGSFRRLTNHLDQMKDAAFSPDSRLLATASVDSTIRLWEAATGRELTVLRGHLSQVDSVAFAEDGVTLASLEENQGVRLWHLPTRREVAVLPMDKAGGWLGFVPGGQTLTLRLSGGGLRLLPAPEPVRETGGR